MTYKKILTAMFLAAFLIAAFVVLRYYLNSLTPKLEETIKVSESKKLNLPDINTKPLPFKTTTNNWSAQAKAVKAIDLDTSFTFYEKEAEKKLPIASLTKVMTALVIMENSNRKDVVTVPSISTVPGEANMGLIKEEQLRVEELLKGILIHSAGDAAETMAVHISGSEASFVEVMNRKAEDLMLTNTHFANPIGLDDTGNYSTAKDLLNLTRVLLNNKDFREIIKTSSYPAKSESGRIYNLTSTNKILDGSKIFGVKTGYTFQAGECLITLAEEDEHEILTIVIGSPDRFGETRALINWIFLNFDW